MDIDTDEVCCKGRGYNRNLTVSFDDDGNDGDSWWLYYTMKDEKNTCVFRQWRWSRPPDDDPRRTEEI